MLRSASAARALARGGVAAFVVGLALAATLAGAQAPRAYVNWENPVFHPIDLSPDGGTLAVVNLPDDRIEFFDLGTGAPVHDELRPAPVGINPTSVRWRSDSELWVVNHVSDSISVVDVATRRVKKTIQTGDEPFDLVFAGNPRRAYVSCSAINAIQVFDLDSGILVREIAIDAEEPRALAVSPDGLTVYAAMFESGNGTTLLGGGIDDSLNISLGRIGFPPNVVSTPLSPYGGQNPPPNDYSDPDNPKFNPPLNPENPPPPKVGLIVRKDDEGVWRDDNGRSWGFYVNGALSEQSGRPTGWDLPDRDLAIVDTATGAVSYVARLMNICMTVGVNPATGRVHVVGTDATNEIRFEPVLNGKFLHVLDAMVDPGGEGATVAGIVDLNPHLDYSAPTIPQEQRDLSIGDPRGIAWTSDGSRGFITGMGSNNLIVVDANGARIGSVPAGDSQGLAGAPPVELEEGPTGLVIDEARGRIYVFNRFHQSVTTLDLASLDRVGETHALHDPSGERIRLGRKHLYDTHKNSGLGHVACASCHIDSRMDRLAWDLGDPSGAMKPVKFVLDTEGAPAGSEAGTHNLLGRGLSINGVGLGQVDFTDFHPMKGPMTTQTLQDIIGHEPLHWRGDRDGIEEFNGAFLHLQGDDENLTDSEMQEFEDMLASITFPPNPHRNWDNTLPTNLPLPGHFVPEVHLPNGAINPAFVEGAPMPNGNARDGLGLYASASLPGLGGRNLDANQIACVTCHTLPTGMGSDLAVGPNPANPLQLAYIPLAAGPKGERHLSMVSVDGSTQRSIKIPHTRNVPDKFGFDTTQVENLAGFGFLHDGGVDSIARFVTEPVFTLANTEELADMVAFMMSFAGGDLPLGNAGSVFDLTPLGPLGKDTHAAVGKQFTIASAAQIPETTIEGRATNWLDLFIAEAEQVENPATNARGIDVIAHGYDGTRIHGWFYDRQGDVFEGDHANERLTRDELVALAAPGREITFTAVPQGTGYRAGVDRDLDGFRDGTEIGAGSDPADPLSVPGLTLSNISTRGRVGTGSQVMIAGIIVGGTLPREVVISGVGPNLADFGVSDVLADPELTLLQGSTVLQSNNDWRLADNADAIADSGYAPANDLEAAIRVSLLPGEYTAILSGVNSTVGNGLVQVFDLDLATPTVDNNLSTRGFVGTGDSVLIGGLTISGTTSGRVLIRGLGPTIGAPPFNVPEPLANPTISLFEGANQIGSNDDWGSASNAADVTATGLAPPNAAEAAILVTLDPGAYTAVLSGVGGAVGNALIEVYQLD